MHRNALSIFFLSNCISFPSGNIYGVKLKVHKCKRCNHTAIIIAFDVVLCNKSTSLMKATKKNRESKFSSRKQSHYNLNHKSLTRERELSPKVDRICVRQTRISQISHLISRVKEQWTMNIFCTRL